MKRNYSIGEALNRNRRVHDVHDVMTVRELIALAYDEKDRDGAAV